MYVFLKFKIQELSTKLIGKDKEHKPSFIAIPVISWQKYVWMSNCADLMNPKEAASGVEHVSINHLEEVVLWNCWFALTAFL